MAVLNHLEPQRVFRFFEELCAIPHGSGNTKAVSDWLVDFAKARGLRYVQDQLNNVVIFRDATPGYESAEPVILQGHMDMVCEKEPGCTKDMAAEGLDLVLEGDTVSAKGTTLGGDDGIAVAMAMAILDDDSLSHPAIEAIFTVDEETGMYGAEGLDVSVLKGRRMLNMDSEDEGIFTVSCAGGARADCCLHEVYGEFVPFRDMLTLCREAGNADMVYEFASTSKITFPGAGVAVMAASEANLKYLSGLLGAQTISYDKVNQLRHVRFLQDKAHVLELMQRHAAILRPKFEAVLAALRGIAPLNIASWTEPKGGYFISCDAMPGTAKRVLALCAEAGVTMTPAGATYPGGNDPADSNIRIAPSFPPVEELEQAMQIFCLALRMAALEKLGI